MIKIEDLRDEDVGREVRYTTGHGDVEFGRITSWNERFIFVLYHTKISARGLKRVARTGSTSESTRPEDLEFVTT